MISKIKSDVLNLFLINNFIFSFSRMFSGAVFVLLLVNQNVSLSSIALAKSFQLILNSLFTLPAGVFADKINSKKSILIACFCQFIYYLILLFPSNSKIIIAECFNGIGLAFYTGAYEAWLIRSCGNDVKTKFSNTFAKASEMSYLGAILAGIIGSFFYSQVFIVSMILMLVCFLIFLFIPFHNEDPYENKNVFRKLMNKNVVKDIFNFFKTQNGLFVLVCGSLYVGFSQIFFQFWQPLFNDIFTENKSKKLGMIFMFLMLSQYLVSRIFRKIFRINENEDFVVFISFLLSSISLLLFLFLYYNFSFNIFNIFFLSIFFFIFIGFSSNGITFLTSYCMHKSNKDVSASTISSVDLFGRLFGSIIIFSSSFFVKDKSMAYGFPIFNIVLIFITIYSFYVYHKNKCFK